MSTSSGLGLAFAAVGAIASVPAAAGPVAVSQSVALGTLLQGNSTSLNFDLNSFLSVQGYTAGEVVGGSVSVFGYSDAAYGAAQNDPYSGYNTQTAYAGSHTGWYSYYVQGYQSCGWWSCYYSGGYTAWASYGINDYQQTSDRDVRHVDAVADKMVVTVGNTSASATASSQSSSAGDFGGYLYDTQYCSNVGNGNCSYTTVYHRERDVYTAVYGALDASLALDATALADLTADGMLSFGVAAAAGQFRLNSVSFDLLLQRAPPAAPDSTNVPEPGSLALTAVALAAAVTVGSTRRRRRGAR